MLTPLALTLRTGDWKGWLFIAFIAGLAAAFIARPQGAGCFGFGCFGNIAVGAVGVLVGRFLVGLVYHGSVNPLVAFLIALGGSLVVLYAGQGLDRLLRRNAPPDDSPPPQIVDSTAREARREIDETPAP